MSERNLSRRSLLRAGASGLAALPVAAAFLPNEMESERARIEMVVAFATARLLADQAGLSEHLQVLGHGRTPNLETLRQVVDRARSLPQAHENLAANGIRKRREDVDFAHVGAVAPEGGQAGQS